MNETFAASPTAAGGNGSGGQDDDIYRELRKNRIIFLGSEVRDDNSNAIIAQMLLLNAQDPSADIWLYINSPGGSVDSGMAIYDTMQWISNDVATVGMGLAASMGQFLLCAGAKGKRYSLPHARIMMHQPSGGAARGSASDIEIVAREILYMRSRMNALLARHTGQPVERIERDFDRDFFMSAPEARAYGMIDRVIGAGEGVEAARGADAAEAAMVG